MRIRRNQSSASLSSRGQVIDIDFMVGYALFAIVVTIIVIKLIGMFDPFTSTVSSTVSYIRNSILFRKIANTDLDKIPYIKEQGVEAVKVTYKVVGLHMPDYDVCKGHIWRENNVINITTNEEQVKIKIPSEVGVAYSFINRTTGNYTLITNISTDSYGNKVITIYPNTSAKIITYSPHDFYVSILNVCKGANCMRTNATGYNYFKVGCIPLTNSYGEDGTSTTSFTRDVYKKEVFNSSEYLLLLKIETWWWI